MLKLPKGLKKKKKGKKSKRKGDDDLFTEEELNKYRREHQQQTEVAEGVVKENEEWSKFKDLTSGVDTVLKRTQGDLDRIKSTSFFQRVPTGVKKIQPDEQNKDTVHRPVVEVTEADFPHLAQTATDTDDKSEYGVTDDESEEEEQDDIFDTSYVEAVERGEVKLAYVPDSPDDIQDDDIFDTSHVDALIKGKEVKCSKGCRSLDIGLAVGVLTGRIDNVTVTTTKRSKRIIPGDLLLENIDKDNHSLETKISSEPAEKSILDTDSDIPITEPIDLSVSLHTSVLLQTKEAAGHQDSETYGVEQDELDEFTLLAAESLEGSAEIIKLVKEEIRFEPVIEESWSAFEADKSHSIFADCIVEDQIDGDDFYIDKDDPFDTSFADGIIPSATFQSVTKEAVILEDDDDFDPRREEIQYRLNNRRKSSVRIHLTDPTGLRESITSDELIDKEEPHNSKDLLAGSTTDLTQLGDSPLNPIDTKNPEIDPFDTTIVDKIAAPGKVELKLLEEELLIGTKSPRSSTVYRVLSDPDFDPRADELKTERRASRPENLVVSKSVVFDIDCSESVALEVKTKLVKPLTPYYTREISITEDINEELESGDIISQTLTRTRSDEDLASKVNKYYTKRRHSEYPQSNNQKTHVQPSDLLESKQADITGKILTPSEFVNTQEISEESEQDPFDTTFAGEIVPSKIELKLLAKEFSCEDNHNDSETSTDLLEPADDIFQVKALTPEPPESTIVPLASFDPFDTSFASNLNPGRTELKLLESEFLN